MAFLNFSLLAGGLLMALPILLHLVMRQRPKQLVFPALRFIQQRREANRRQLQLRHWILLALRCGAVLLAALALARPSVASGLIGSWIAIAILGVALLVALVITLASIFGRRSLAMQIGSGATTAILAGIVLWMLAKVWGGGGTGIGDQEAPLAAVVVVDTSPRMQYRHENRTRLEQAQQIGAWLLEQFPEGSEIAICDSKPGSGAFAVDRAAAAKTLERLRTIGSPRPLLDMVSSAIELAKQNPKHRKEVYVFSDLTQAAWQNGDAATLKKLVAENEQILLYVIDVGVKEPRNAALGKVQLSSEMIPSRAQVTVETTLAATGMTDARQVSLYLEKYDPTLPIIKDDKPIFPEAVHRGTQTIQLTADPQQVRFPLQGLVEPGTYQGQFRLAGEDGLALDDVRYFTIEVQPALRILVVTGDGVSSELFVRMLRDNPQTKFNCDVISQAELAQTDFVDYRAVCLLDPLPAKSDVWEKLVSYAERGGGVGIFLGHHAQPAESFQEAAAAQLLGGKLAIQTRAPSGLYLDPRSFDHPITAAYRALDTSVPWDRFPIFFHWNLTDLAAGTRVIIPYGNGMPALTESRIGRGRALVLTTPVTDPLRPVGRKPWNELLTGEDAWPGFVLVNEMLLYLTGSSEARLNYTTGETAVLRNDPATQPERYQLFTPLDKPQDILARDGRITVRFTDNPGAYRLRGQRGGPVVRGFAVNLTADVGDLTRWPADKLSDLLGKDRFHLAKSKEEIDRAVGSDRIGSEFYPLLMLLLVGALAGEQVLANRFYRKDE
ncbi:BatA domain-containing protein [Anatilimnocola floriformis]|uniref:BatA domain-containing protein n=1 Tax=Anatilimnocola floriformis TaxID=2948575 RepID=UPI0020C59EE9|nr:BatA domain-containing protein [Anatilimnocola floriformis]